MKLLLKNKHIYLPVSNNVVTENATFAIEVLDDLNLDMYNKTVKINGNQSTFTDSFTIHKKELMQKYLSMSIVLTHKDTGESIEYQADPYPITRAFVLGRPFNECYPSIVNNMTERLNNLERKAALTWETLIDHTAQLNEATQDINLLGQAIIEIKEEGEIV